MSEPVALRRGQIWLHKESAHCDVCCAVRIVLVAKSHLKQDDCPNHITFIVMGKGGEFCATETYFRAQHDCLIFNPNPLPREEGYYWVQYKQAKPMLALWSCNMWKFYSSTTDRFYVSAADSDAVIVLSDKLVPPVE